MLFRPTILLFLTLLLLAGSVARGQAVVTSLTYTLSGGGSQTNTDNATFDNYTAAINTFSTSSMSYNVSGVVDYVGVRRNSSTGNADNSSVWYANDSSNCATNMYAPHATDYGTLLKSNNLLAGSDNTFANGTAANTGNIERLDFIFKSGITATSSLSFAVFDRGDAGVHDGFGIAVITSLNGSVDSNGVKTPTAYAQLTRVAGGWGGTANPVQDLNYTLFRYSNGNNISSSDANNETGTQGIGGLVFSTADLGITAGTKIYGYSLFGYDVTSDNNSANLVNYTNTTYFPTNTDSTTGSGGIDLAAVNGLALTGRHVPEPSTYAAGAVGIMVLATGLRRLRVLHRRNATTSMAQPILSL